jgi:hypothetical protein
VGWVLIGVGILLVLLGYLGVSRESIVEKQIPYLVSGGIGGVLVCVLGAYFLGTEELRRDSGRLDRLEQMVEEVHRLLLPAADDDDGAAADTPAPPSPKRPAYVAVDGGATYHLADCALAAGKAAEKVTAAQIARRKLRPCPLCGADA